MNSEFEKDENISEEEEFLEMEIEAETEAEACASELAMEAEIVMETEEKPKKSWKRELLEWVESLGIAVIAAALIMNFVFCMVRVDGASMEPTLQHKDQLFVFRLGYQPKDGDIVVFKPKSEDKRLYIKRVIATEGQSIDIKDGRVFVEGTELHESYIKDMIRMVPSGDYPKTVPEGCVFVLGDNRNNSKDSRDEAHVGMVTKKSIIGKALFRVMPLNKMGSLYSDYSTN